MANGAFGLPEKGADTATELYVKIGEALSWWESSEDVILGLFRQICDGIEPMAVTRFVVANRSTRYSMLKAAMQVYPYRFEEGEIEKITSALNKLEKLSKTRNELVHGHVAGMSMQENGIQVASGNFLMPSFNEGGFHERSFRYHHTTQSIAGFIEELRNWRGQIMDVHGDLLNRTQDRLQGISDGMSFVETARRIARLEIHGDEAVFEMAKVIGYVQKARSQSPSN